MYAFTIGALPALSEGGTVTVNDAELARLIVSCAGGVKVRRVVGTDFAVDRGGALGAAVVGVDGLPVDVADDLMPDLASVGAALLLGSIDESIGPDPLVADAELPLGAFGDPGPSPTEVSDELDVGASAGVFVTDAGPMTCGFGAFPPQAPASPSSAAVAITIALRTRNRLGAHDRPRPLTDLLRIVTPGLPLASPSTL